MSLKALSNWSLLMESRDGNEKAFNLLFERYFNKLYRYTLHHTGNEELSEELVMDLMFWLWNKKDVINLTGDMDAYLFRAMKNSIFSYYRRKALITVPLDAELNDKADEALSADALLLKDIELEYSKSLDLLTPQRRKVFQLSREEDMTYAEIATHLNLSVKTVEAHVTASLRFMRSRFKDYADLMAIIIILRLL